MAASIKKRIAGALVLLAWALFGLTLSTRATTVSYVVGIYSGDDNATKTVDFLGFDPDILLLRNITGMDTTYGIWRQDGMVAGEAERLASATSAVPNRISSLDSNGFTVGTHPDANAATNTYIFMAWDVDSGFGSYVGDGVANKTVDVFWGSQMVWVARQDGGSGVNGMTHFTFSSWNGWSTTHEFNREAQSDAILAVDVASDKNFEVSDANKINRSGETYHYFSMWGSTDEAVTGTYLGTGSAQTISLGNSVDPSTVFIQSIATTGLPNQYPMVFAPLPTPGTGYVFDNLFGATDYVTELGEETGDAQFILSTDNYVNNINVTFAYWAQETLIAASLAVTVRKLNAKRYANGTLLSWKTGMEADNLGFHLHRVSLDESGQEVRSRVTDSMISGASLFVRRETGRLADGRRYHHWDTSDDARDGRVLRYELEAIDLYGRREIAAKSIPKDSAGEPPSVPAPKRKRVVDVRRSLQSADQAANLAANLANRLNAQQKHALANQSATPDKTVYASTTSSVEHVADKLRPAKDKIFGNKEDANVCRGMLPSTKTSVQWELAKSDETIKIAIDETGWYQVKAQALFDAGLNQDVDPSALQLFVDGVEVPLEISGAKDGRLDGNETLGFYGVAMDVSATADRVYWLVSGLQEGKRIGTIETVPNNTHVLDTVTGVSERQDRSTYVARARRKTGNFFGATIAVEPVDQLLTLHDLEASGSDDAILSVALRGINFHQKARHKLDVYLNGVRVSKLEFGASAEMIADLKVPHALLQEGDNVVRFVRTNSDDVIMATMVDYLRLTYQRKAVALDDELWVYAQADASFQVDGFSNGDLAVYDVTDEFEPRRILGGDRTSFAAPDTGPRVILALGKQGIKEVKSIKVNRPSSWHDGAVDGDFVIVTHSRFNEAAELLADHRRDQGWGVVVTDIEDLYDEFTFGHKTPWAIRCLLSRANFSWDTKPTHMLLVGDATFDPRDHLGFGYEDLVPTKLYPSHMLETAADDWYGDIDDDRKPNIAIGRWPVRTVDEAMLVARKSIDYDAQGAAPSWSNRVAVMTDQEFAKTLEGANDLLGDKVELLTGAFDDGQAQLGRDQLTGWFNEGVSVLSYIGHGSTEVWASGELFRSDDALALQNGAKLPFVVSFTCLNGFFHDIYTESLSEALLKAPNGGAIAMFSSAGMGWSFNLNNMNKSLARALVAGEQNTIGTLVNQIKIEEKAHNRGAYKWALIGDPTVTLRGLQTGVTPTGGDENDDQPGCACNTAPNRGLWCLAVIFVVVFALRRRRARRSANH